jgi:hypothetical protein
MTLEECRRHCNDLLLTDEELIQLRDSIREITEKTLSEYFFGVIKHEPQTEKIYVPEQ